SLQNRGAEGSPYHIARVGWIIPQWQALKFQIFNLLAAAQEWHPWSLVSAHLGDLTQTYPAYKARARKGALQRLRLRERNRDSHHPVLRYRLSSELAGQYGLADGGNSVGDAVDNDDQRAGRAAQLEVRAARRPQASEAGVELVVAGVYISTP